jgi:hypothetical protein
VVVAGALSHITTMARQADGRFGVGDPAGALAIDSGMAFARVFDVAPATTPGAGDAGCGSGSAAVADASRAADGGSAQSAPAGCGQGSGVAAVIGIAGQVGFLTRRSSMRS